MNILDQIVAVKRAEVARLRGPFSPRSDRRDFAAALRGPVGSVALIAEVKKASPSAGVIRADFDPVALARAYAAAGAAALSVLTDEQFFQGHLDYLGQIRAAVGLPILRKDFIIDERQIHESAARGADAILLIVAILDDGQLHAFSALARAVGLAALVEVHDEAELDRALAAEAELIGVNNRNLKDFTVSLATTERLAARLFVGGSDIPVATGRGRNAPPTRRRLLVAESGIHTRADVARVAAAGANAILVGESLMRSADLAGKARELLGR